MNQQIDTKATRTVDGAWCKYPDVLPAYPNKSYLTRIKSPDGTVFFARLVSDFQLRFPEVEGYVVEAWIDFPKEELAVERKDFMRRLKERARALTKRERTYVEIGWRPFPEEKPKKSGLYLVTSRDHADDDEPAVSIDKFRKKTGHFWTKMDDDVLAWAKLPKPYAAPLPLCLLNEEEN